MSVTYTATLPVRDQTVLHLSSLLHAERLRRGTRTGTRALSPFNQAVLVLRWFLDATRVRQLATDNQISTSTAYDYLDEGVTVLAALHSLDLAAQYADTVLVLDQGQVNRSGPPRDVFEPQVLREVFGVGGSLVDDPVTGTARLLLRPL